MKRTRLQIRLLLLVLLFLLLNGSETFGQSGKKKSKQDDFGKSFFEKDSIHTIRINFASCNYWDSLTIYKKRQDSLEIPLYVQATVTIDKKSFHACGVRFKGESSYQFYPGKKKPFRIKFDKFVKGQDFNGLQELNLNNNFKDPTMVREKIYLDMMKRHGLPAPRATYAKVYVNDKYHGLYLVTENIDDVFLETRFNDTKGNLFQGEPLANLVYLGNDQKKYFQRYILRNNRTKNDWSDLVRFIKTINDTNLSEAGYVQKLESVFDLDKCLKAWAINNLLGNIDAYNMFYPHNYFLYHDSLTNRWNWISLDGNYAFAAWNPVLNFPQLARMSILRPDSVPYKGDRPLLDRTIVTNRYLRERYLTMIDNLLLNDLMPERMNRTIDSLKLRIRTAVYADINKMYSNTDFDTNFESTIGDPMDPGNFIPGIKIYMSERLRNVEAEMKELRNRTE